MAKTEMVEVTLTTRTKVGGKIYPEGRTKVPAGVLDVLTDADLIATEDGAGAEPSGTGGQTPAPATDLTEEQTQQLMAAITTLGNEKVTVAKVNAALKEAGAGFKATGAQVNDLLTPPAG